MEPSREAMAAFERVYNKTYTTRGAQIRAALFAAYAVDYPKDKPITGFFNTLTPEQKEAALAYRGPENFGRKMESFGELSSAAPKITAPPLNVRWVNIYKNSISGYYNTQKQAIKASCGNVVGVMRLDFEGEKLTYYHFIPAGETE